MRRLVVVLMTLACLVASPNASAWTWPLGGDVLRPYVLGSDPYAGGQHRGVDISGRAGEPVRAPVSGVVSYAGVVPASGRTVTIQHEGYAVSLTHLGEISVVKGTAVGEGDVVGTAGSSGEPEWPTSYVHLGIRVSDAADGYVDPLTLLPSGAPAPVEAPRAAPAAPGSAAEGVAAAALEDVSAPAVGTSEPLPDPSVGKVVGRSLAPPPSELPPLGAPASSAAATALADRPAGPVAAVVESGAHPRPRTTATRDVAAIPTAGAATGVVRADAGTAMLRGSGVHGSVAETAASEVGALPVEAACTSTDRLYRGSARGPCTTSAGAAAAWADRSRAAGRPSEWAERRARRRDYGGSRGAPVGDAGRHALRVGHRGSVDGRCAHVRTHCRSRLRVADCAAP